MIDENSNICAFLEMLAISELGQAILNQSDNGYNVLVGSLPGDVKTFSGYLFHPDRLEHVRGALYSTAAGRYQIIFPTWKGIVEKIALPDFSPDSQDKAAVELIKERGAYEDLVAGRWAVAIAKCQREWASLPGAGYGQHENTLASLYQVYLAKGGVSSNGHSESIQS